MHRRNSMLVLEQSRKQDEMAALAAKEAATRQREQTKSRRAKMRSWVGDEQTHLQKQAAQEQQRGQKGQSSAHLEMEEARAAQEEAAQQLAKAERLRQAELEERKRKQEIEAALQRHNSVSVRNDPRRSLRRHSSISVMNQGLRDKFLKERERAREAEQ
eukprot:m.272421 g.272421  ORF g.272421 m.272421 type:complete len:159 (+) comp19331_c7_seq2:1476-1952(+)